MKKRQLKRIFAAFIATAAAFTLAATAACTPNEQSDNGGNGGQIENPDNTPDNTPDNNPDNTPEENPDDTPEENTPVYWNKVAAYSTGFSDAEGGVAEIVQYNADNGKLYLVNGKTQTIDIVTLSEYGEGELQTIFTEDTDRISFNTLVDEHPQSFANGFEVGDITSVAVNTQLDLIAVAVQHSNYSSNGAIVLLNYDGSFHAAYPAGVQPDMVTFAGNKVLTANEGEPRLGYGEGIVDPEGSVTVLDLSSSTPQSVTVGFESFDSSRADLVADGVILKKDAAPSVDLEPEYIASYGNHAYVALQEANAIATLNLDTLQFESVKGLGFKDHSAQGNGLDLLEDGKADIANQDVLGVYMPDGLAAYQAGGKTYIVTANEGDAREWGDYEGVEKYEMGDTKVEVLVNGDFDGLEADKHYVLGGRSFSVWDASDMSLVFDSGDMIESYIASGDYAAYFNCSNDDVELDSRSKKKGPEPEAVNVQTIDGKTYAFVALERQGGVIMFDITDLNDVTITSYANSRDYSGDMLGDVAPESIDFISADNSPNGANLLVVANENSGTVALYAMESEQKTYEMHSTFNAAQRENADHLLIWSVFGNGGKDDGQTSNDFISIYNPTDAAVDLTGYKVNYSTLRDGGAREWTQIELSGSIAAGAYYVIIGADTGNEHPLISFAQGEYDIKYDFEIDNKQYTVQLVDGEGGVVDALGVDEDASDENDELSEGSPIVGINKHSVVTRTDASDSDNNATDFSIVDLRDVENASDYKPVRQ